MQALARLLWQVKGDSAQGQEALIRAFTAVWLDGSAHPDDAIRFPTDVEGVTGSLGSHEALGDGLNTTHALLDHVYGLLGVSLYAPAGEWANAGGSQERGVTAQQLSETSLAVCDKADAADSVLRSPNMRPAYIWNTHLDPNRADMNAKLAAAEDCASVSRSYLPPSGNVAGENQFEWGLGAPIRGVQRWQVHRNSNPAYTRGFRRQRATRSCNHQRLTLFWAGRCSML